MRCGAGCSTPAQPVPSLDESLGRAQACTVLVAAGPYTASTDLAYSALDKILQTCKQAAAKALVLMGPFVDEEHPQIATGTLDTPFQELFSQASCHGSACWQSLMNPSVPHGPVHCSQQ